MGAERPFACSALTAGIHPSAVNAWQASFLGSGISFTAVRASATAMFRSFVEQYYRQLRRWDDQANGTSFGRKTKRSLTTVTELGCQGRLSPHNHHSQRSQ